MNLKLGLHDTICLTDSFVFRIINCVNFKAMRYESISFNRIVAKIASLNPSFSNKSEI